MPEKLDGQYWERRYISEDTPWNLGTPSPPLCRYTDQYTNLNARVLIPGAGDSQDAIYLHSRGFTDITICDISPTAIDKSRQRTRGFEGINYIAADFFTLEGKYDLILEQTFFCALSPSMRTQYIHKMTELLVEGGTLAGLLFASEFENEGPPFGGVKDDYTSLFGNYLHIHTMQMCYNSAPPRQGNELFFICKKIATM